MKYLQERLEECGIVIKFRDQLQLCAINEWEIVRRYQHHGDVGQVYNSGHILQEGRSGHQKFDRNGFKWEDHIEALLPCHMVKFVLGYCMVLFDEDITINVCS